MSVFRNRLWWSASILAALVAGATLSYRHDAQPGRGPLADRQLAEALIRMRWRPVAAQLSAELPWRPYARRSLAVDSGALALRAATARITTGQPPLPPQQRAHAYLLAGNADAAIALLQRTPVASRDAETWSDLAAAYLARADASASGEAVVDALGAASAALAADPLLPAARFNRMLCLERLGLHEEARRDARVYLTSTPGSPWAREARAVADRVYAAPRAEWMKELPDVEEAALSGDRARVDAAVRRFPQLARTWAEGPMLAEWADAEASGNREVARRKRIAIRALATSLASFSGERFLGDALDAIDDAARNDAKRLTALAAAHRTYRDARLAYRDNRHVVAEQGFVRSVAMFREARSPMELVARYYVGSALYSQFHAAESARALDALIESQPEKRGYVALAAQARWERGLAALVQGHFSEAVDTMTRSRDLFARLGEEQNAATMDVLLAEALDFLDDPDAAWPVRKRAFESLAIAGDARRRAGALTAAAEDRVRREQWTRALTLFDLAANTASATSEDALAAFILARRSRVHYALGQRTAAAADRRAARLRAASIRDAVTNLRISAELDLADAEAAPDAATAARLFQNAITYYTHTGVVFVPAILLERARMYVRAGKGEAARADLLQGIDILEAHRGDVRDLAQRAVMFTTSRRLFDLAIAQAFSRRDYAEAFELSERARARAILDGLQSVGREGIAAFSLAAIQHEIAADAAVVSYVAVAGGLRAIVVTSTAIASRDLGDTAALSDLASKFRRAIVAEDDGAAMTISAQLYDALVRPLSSSLSSKRAVAWVTASALRGIPMLALYDRQRKRFVIDDVVSIVAPSASAALVASASASMPPDACATAVAATRFDSQNGELGPLRLAAGEAANVARLRRGSNVLAGERATRSAVVKELRQCPIFHFAGHATPGRTAGDARLLVAPTAGESDSLTALSVAAMRLPSLKLAVLAACRATGEDGSGDGAESLASAFLVAGAATVVATPWPVSDEAAASFSTRFHTALIASGDPAVALAQSLRAEDHDSAGRARSPARWAAFAVIGGSRALVRNSGLRTEVRGGGGRR